MIILSFLYNKRVSDKEIVEVPAILCTNNTYTMAEIKRLFPGLKYQVAYTLEAYGSDFPMDVVLYDGDKDLNLIQINAELEEEIRKLKQALLKENPSYNISGGKNSEEQEVSEEVVLDEL